MSKAVQQHINIAHFFFPSAAASLYHSKPCISLNGFHNNLPLIQLLADIILSLLSFLAVITDSKSHSFCEHALIRFFQEPFCKMHLIFAGKVPSCLCKSQLWFLCCFSLLEKLLATWKG